jgi:integrase
MQQGSVIQPSRQDGPVVWQFRWSDKDLNGAKRFGAGPWGRSSR